MAFGHHSTTFFHKAEKREFKFDVVPIPGAGRQLRRRRRLGLRPARQGQVQGAGLGAAQVPDQQGGAVQDRRRQTLGPEPPGLARQPGPGGQRPRALPGRAHRAPARARGRCPPCRFVFPVGQLDILRGLQAGVQRAPVGRQRHRPGRRDGGQAQVRRRPGPRRRGAWPAPVQRPCTSPERRRQVTDNGGTPCHTDPYALAERFRHYLRVTDVVDGLDAVGRADVTLPDAAIRPLWMGMRFWGPAVTMRVVPANQRMRPVTREDALEQHGIWFGERASSAWASFGARPAPERPRQARVRRRHLHRRGAGDGLLGLEQHHGGAGRRGRWGSSPRGTAGTRTRSSCSRRRWPAGAIGRPIIPGRVELVDLDVPVGSAAPSCARATSSAATGTACVVVPLEVAEEVLYFAARIAIDDKQGPPPALRAPGQSRRTRRWTARRPAAYFKDIVGSVSRRRPAWPEAGGRAMKFWESSERDRLLEPAPRRRRARVPRPR